MKRSSERSKPLHNFTLPPHLKWGHQKFLTCIRVDPHAQSPFQSRPDVHLPNSSSAEDEEGKSDANAARPWNLRTRRSAAYKGGGTTNAKLAESPPLRRTTESLRLLLKGNNGTNCDLNKLVGGKEKTRLSVPLLKEEIEEDFAVMAGIRPPRRPKKRPRVVQKQLDSLFPGLWLSEVTLDSYKVPQMPES